MVKLSALMYRTRPHSTTSLSSVDMLLKHKPNNGLPSTDHINKSINNKREMDKKKKSKEYTEAKQNKTETW